MLTRKKEFQGSGRASTLVPAAPAPRHPLAKILVPVSATLSLPIPRASNFTPDTCSANLSMGSGMGKGVSSAGNRGVGPSGEKGAWSRRETQKRTPPPPGCGRGTSRAPARHAPAREACSAWPRGPAAPRGRPRGGRPPARPRPFCRPALGQGQVPAASRTPLPGSLHAAALTPLHPRRARPC